jgi:hypothetical protein
MTPYQKVMARLDRTAGPDGCWTWTGSRHPYGYGRLGRTYVHRIVAEHHEGRPLTSDDFVCHRCDNPPCANPRHLYVGDAAANMRDMAAKGRARQQADVDVDAIVWLHKRYVSHARIARLLGVSDGVVRARLKALGLAHRRGQQTHAQMASADAAEREWIASRQVQQAA